MIIQYKDESFDGLKLKMDGNYPWDSKKSRHDYYLHLENSHKEGSLCEMLKKESRELLHIKISYSFIYAAFSVLFMMLSILFTVICNGCTLGIGFLLYSGVLFLAHRCYNRQAKKTYETKKTCEKIIKN